MSGSLKIDTDNNVNGALRIEANQTDTKADRQKGGEAEGQTIIKYRNGRTDVQKD